MNHSQTFGEFKCTYCGYIVSSARWLSGVDNRNHCPYCLWSCHLDLYSAGDRLSACKALMHPIALTAKRSRNKYNRGPGELMLVHLCTGCGDISINRIAADDDANTLLEIFDISTALPSKTCRLLLASEIDILSVESLPAVKLQLFGEMQKSQLHLVRGSL